MTLQKIFIDKFKLMEKFAKEKPAKFLALMTNINIIVQANYWQQCTIN